MILVEPDQEKCDELMAKLSEVFRGYVHSDILPVITTIQAYSIVQLSGDHLEAHDLCRRTVKLLTDEILRQIEHVTRNDSQAIN
jgi:hypothetical protein